jgi:hypothetical protein
MSSLIKLLERLDEMNDLKKELYKLEYDDNPDTNQHYEVLLEIAEKEISNLRENIEWQKQSK